nr:MAG TPA: hypothetical protein [Bacteriophage sp.]
MNFILLYIQDKTIKLLQMQFHFILTEFLLFYIQMKLLL